MIKHEAKTILVKYIHNEGYAPKVSIVYCEEKKKFFEFGLGKPGGLWLVWKDDGTVQDIYNIL